MKNYISKSLTLLIISFTFFSCSKENININNNNQFSSGYFVTNEGNFGSGNGSLSYVDENNQVTNNVFSSINSSVYLDKTFSNTKNTLTGKLKNTAPDWATHFKLFVKETGI